MVCENPIIRGAEPIFFCAGRKFTRFVGFYFSVEDKCCSFQCITERGSFDRLQGLLQLLALAVLSGVSSRGEEMFQY